jgi:hypothetical protein
LREPVVAKPSYTQAVLSILGNDWVQARHVRAALNEGRSFWSRWSVVGFFRLMTKLQDAGLVEFEYREIVVANTPVKQRWYRRKYGQLN